MSTQLDTKYLFSLIPTAPPGLEVYRYNESPIFTYRRADSVLLYYSGTVSVSAMDTDEMYSLVAVYAGGRIVYLYNLDYTGVEYPDLEIANDVCDSWDLVDLILSYCDLSDVSAPEDRVSLQRMLGLCRTVSCPIRELYSSKQVMAQHIFHADWAWQT